MKILPRHITHSLNSDHKKDDFLLRLAEPDFSLVLVFL